MLVLFSSTYQSWVTLLPSTSSGRTVNRRPKDDSLIPRFPGLTMAGHPFDAVRPEVLEGRTAKHGTVSREELKNRNKLERFLLPHISADI